MSFYDEPGTPGKHQMRIPHTREGDMKVEWDPKSDIEVEAARKTFDEMKGKGFTFFKMKTGGRKGEQIRFFEPDARKIIGVAQMVGG
jgi:hypothetical protein